MWFFLLLPALAVEIPTKTGSEIGVGCVVNIQASAPILILDDQQYLLHDDGKEPDTSSSDGIFSIFISTNSQKKATALLVGDDNKVLWSGDVPFPPKGQQTWLLIDELQEGQRPLVQVKFKPLIASHGRRMNTTSWWTYWLLIGIGILLGWSFRRPLEPRIRRWNTNKNDVENRICIVCDERELLDVVEKYARGRLVLLCTNKDRHHLFSKIAKNHSIFLMNDGVPCEKKSLLTQLSILESLGDTILILDGIYGLVQPLPSESPSSVLNEILSSSGHMMCAVFLFSEVPDGIETSKAPHESTA